MIKLFLGPSLNGRYFDCKSLCILPPAKRGDLFTQANEPNTTAIALIDGVFGDSPSVLHKEILWALSKDIPIYGASSMGSIRASEMDEYGMRGTGWIYEAYRRGRYSLMDTEVWERVNGRNQSGADAQKIASEVWLANLLDKDALTDDDDVALIYAPQALGYRALSEPLINIVKTVQSAPVDNALKREALLSAKSIFFPERSYDKMLELLTRQNVFDYSELVELADWCKDCPIDQKAIDACELLEALAENGPDLFPQTPRPTVEFIETSYWKDVCPPSDWG